MGLPTGMVECHPVLRCLKFPAMERAHDCSSVGMVNSASGNRKFSLAYCHDASSKTDHEPTERRGHGSDSECRVVRAVFIRLLDFVRVWTL